MLSADGVTDGKNLLAITIMTGLPAKVRIPELAVVFFATVTNGNGFAFLTNGEKINRFPVMIQTQKNILKLMNWENKRLNENLQEIPLNLKQKLIGTYVDFLYGQGAKIKILEKNNRLYVESTILEHFKGKNENELLYLKNGLFKIVDYPNLLQFDFSDGKLNSVTLIKDKLNNKINLTEKQN